MVKANQVNKHISMHLLTIHNSAACKESSNPPEHPDHWVASHRHPRRSHPRHVGAHSWNVFLKPWCEQYQHGPTTCTLTPQCRTPLVYSTIGRQPKSYNLIDGLHGEILAGLLWRWLCDNQPGTCQSKLSSNSVHPFSPSLAHRILWIVESTCHRGVGENMSMNYRHQSWAPFRNQSVAKSLAIIAQVPRKFDKMRCKPVKSI